MVLELQKTSENTMEEIKKRRSLNYMELNVSKESGVTAALCEIIIQK